MKRVIKGKRYDTEKATVIANAAVGDAEEWLYRKKGGEFFIHGMGGRYSLLGEVIIPMSYQAAS
jgi:hypothetical protein